MLTAGVIGLGQIGGGVAICLAKAGSLSGVYDIFPEAADKLEGVPGCLTSPAELAKASDAIIIAVVDAKQVRSVLQGDEGVLAGAKKGTCVLIQSTISLPDLKDISAIAAEAGVIIVDCGVSGGNAAAEKGLVSLVGADEATFNRVKPILEDFSKLVAHMGDFGAGMAAKIARNTIVYNVWRAGHEGATLAKAAGVDLHKFAEAIIKSEVDQVAGPTIWMNRESEPENDPAEKALREHVCVMMKKDLAAAQDLAGTLKVELPSVSVTLSSAEQILRID